MRLHRLEAGVAPRPPTGRGTRSGARAGRARRSPGSGRSEREHADDRWPGGGCAPRRRSAARRSAMQTTMAVPMSGCLSSSAQAKPTTIRSGLHMPPSVLHRRRPRGQQLRRVEHERDLEQLRGLELERAGAEPARGAVHGHADAGQHHGERERERDQQEDRREGLHERRARAGRARASPPGPTMRERHVALEVVRRVALTRRAATPSSWPSRPSPRRTPAGERGGVEDRVLERLGSRARGVCGIRTLFDARTSDSSSTRRRKCSPRSS